MLQKTIDWRDPLKMASSVSDAEQNWAFLYSAHNEGYTGKFSFLALRKDREITDDCFEELDKSLTSAAGLFDNAWFGYLGYGLKNTLENLPKDSKPSIDMPDLWMVKYRLILCFDHENKKIVAYASEDGDFKYIPDETLNKPTDINVLELHSNMTKESYLEKVAIIKEAIIGGDLYQANLTRKFYGKISFSNPFDIFAKLCEISPSSYSTYMKLGDYHILSSSPERFLNISKDGHVDTRPIKGSARRFSDKTKDEESKQALSLSDKDKAENLMIVDLSRNDLSRSCDHGSIAVDNLFEIASYPTIHHMVSTVTGQKRKTSCSLDVVKGCFPPGSMTGTPKIKAMELCSSLEELKRGVYSGAIGWFGGDGSADLSVVIRTIVIKGDQFEFQVGGAIVADSDPIKEWEETITKAKAVSKSLGIDLRELEGI